MSEMNIRIDSVFSLNTQDRHSSGSTSDCTKDIENFNSLTEKYCAVNLEKIDLGTKKYVSYRKWMKNHKHCSSICFKKRGDKQCEELNVIADNRRLTRKRKHELNNTENNQNPHLHKLCIVKTMHDKTNFRTTEIYNVGNLHGTGEVKNSKSSVRIYHDFFENATDNGNFALDSIIPSTSLIKGNLKKRLRVRTPKRQYNDQKLDKNDDSKNDISCRSTTNSGKTHDNTANNEPKIDDPLLLHKKIKKEPDIEFETRTNVEQVFQDLQNPVSEQSFRDICDKIAKTPKEKRASYIEKLRSILDESDINNTVENESTDVDRKSELQIHDDPKNVDSLNENKIVKSCTKSTLEIDSTKTVAAFQMFNIGGKQFVMQANADQNVESSESQCQSKTIDALNVNASAPTSLYSNVSQRYPVNNNNITLVSLPSQNQTNIINSAQSKPKELHGHLITQSDGKQFFLPLLEGKTTVPSKPDTQINLNIENPKTKTFQTGGSVISTPGMSGQLQVPNQSLLADVGKGKSGRIQTNVTNILPQFVNQLNRDLKSEVSQQVSSGSKQNILIPNAVNSQGTLQLTNTLNASQNAGNLSSLGNVNNFEPVNQPKLLLPVNINGVQQNVLFDMLPDGRLQLSSAVDGQKNTAPGNNGHNKVLGLFSNSNVGNQQQLFPLNQQVTTNQNVSINPNSNFVNHNIPIIQPQTSLHHALSNHIKTEKQNVLISSSHGGNQSALNNPVHSSLNQSFLVNQQQINNQGVFNSQTQPIIIGLNGGQLPIMQQGISQMPIINTAIGQNPILNPGLDISTILGQFSNLTNLQLGQNTQTQNLVVLGQLAQPTQSVPNMQTAPSPKQLPSASQLLLNIASHKIGQAKTTITGSTANPPIMSIFPQNISRMSNNNIQMKTITDGQFVKTGNVSNDSKTANIQHKTGKTSSQHTSTQRPLRPLAVSSAGKEADSKPVCSFQTPSTQFKSSQHQYSAHTMSNASSAPSSACNWSSLQFDKTMVRDFKKEIKSPTTYAINVSKDTAMNVSQSNRMAEISTQNSKKELTRSLPVPIFIRTSTGNIMPTSTVKPFIEQGNRPQNVAPVFTPSSSEKTIRTSSATQYIIQPMVQLNNHQNGNTLVKTVIPAQGYAKSPALTTRPRNSSSASPLVTQTVKDLAQTHPLLQKSLQSGNCSTSMDVKRSKRKPQVVVRVDPDAIDVDEETSSPEKDYSMFNIRTCSVSTAVTASITPRIDPTIVERGLRIPDSMLEELRGKNIANLQKKSVETAIQKLMLNKLFLNKHN
ncbi:protein PF3D7_1417600-like [Mytilus trossulus]|uniref:protein PF3D7_1417600-like n=1 Tax=Mytilus trossulus TaxID=6551 RepID=UPI0030047605